MAKTKTKRKAMSQQDVELTQMVKRANERLRALERKGLTNAPAYRAIERLALQATKIMATTGAGQIKFSTNIRSLSINERSALRSEVTRFLQADTSTVKGVKKVMEKIIPAYSERFGDFDFSGVDMQEALNIWSTSIVKQFESMYGSELTAEAVNTAITNFSSLEESAAFLQDQFGKPWADVEKSLENLNFTPSDNENLPWDWNDIFKKGT